MSRVDHWWNGYLVAGTFSPCALLFGALYSESLPHEEGMAMVSAWGAISVISIPAIIAFFVVAGALSRNAT